MGGGAERFYSGEEVGKKSLTVCIDPSLLWVLNFCKNFMKFGNANIFTNLNVLATQ